MDENTEQPGPVQDLPPEEAPQTARVRRNRKKAAADTGPEQIGPAVQQVLADAQVERQPGDEPAAGHAAAVPRKRYTPPEDPFGFENITGTANRVRLLKSEGEGAWVIRFDKNPNDTEGHSKENPHPVLGMLKREGYRWGFDGGDGKGGWGKGWQGDPYGTDHMEARRVLKQAAEMIGAPQQEQDVPGF